MAAGEGSRDDAATPRRGRGAGGVGRRSAFGDLPRGGTGGEGSARAVRPCGRWPAASRERRPEPPGRPGDRYAGRAPDPVRAPPWRPPALAARLEERRPVAAVAQRLRLVDAPPRLRARPAVVLPGPRPRHLQHLHRNLLVRLPGVQRVQDLQKLPVFRPRSRRLRGGGRRPIARHRSSMRVVTAVSGRLKPRLAMIPSPGPNARPDGTMI